MEIRSEVRFTFSLKCQNCGCQDKNYQPMYFGDDNSELCINCAIESGFEISSEELEYIKNYVKTLNEYCEEKRIEQLKNS